MTPTTASGRRASGDGRPLDDGTERSSPIEGTSSIARDAARDAARLALLPARLATAPVRFAVRTAGSLVRIGAGAVTRLLGSDEEAPPARSASPRRRREADSAARAAARRHGAEAAAAPPPPAATAPPPAATAPPRAAPAPDEHVSEEAVVVGEFAERGAEDGPGAEVDVDPPWEGYDGQSAADVVRRLDGASREELAAVQLYEGFGRRRRTILDAAERGLRRASEAAET